MKDKGKGQTSRPENSSYEVSNTLRYLQAGRLQQFVPVWKDITDDPEVLDWVGHVITSS